MSKFESFSPYIKIGALVEHPVSLRLKTDGSKKINHIELELKDHVTHPDEEEFIKMFKEYVLPANKYAVFSAISDVAKMENKDA